MNKLLQVSALIGGLSLTGASHAQTIENVTIAGPYDVWLSDGSGGLTLANPVPPPPPLDEILEGNAGSPGSNIELNNDGAFNVSTTLTGTLDGLIVDIRSPTQADWQADGYALAYDYVNGALASIGKTSADWNPGGLGGACGLFDAAVTVFVNGPPGPPTGAQRVSDPNIGYVRLEGNEVKIGLQGQLDVTTAGIHPLFSCVNGYTYNPQSPPQASEVMALTISRAGETLYDDFAYSFTATPTGQATSGGSYDGNYEITVPPPVSVPAVSALGLAGSAAGLLAIGLAGLRRRRSG